MQEIPFADVLDLDAVDRDAPMPLYHQLRDALLAPMRAGQWREGDPIPTEREICDAYNVSRITVRRAIDELVRDGYLLTQQGRGTFVARPKIHRNLSQLKSFSEEMATDGHRPGSQLLSLRHERASGDVASALQVAEGAWIWVVDRLRLADDEPMGLSTAHLVLPPDVVLTPAELQAEVSLWNILRGKGINFAESEVTIQAVAANVREAEMLRVAAGAPLLMVLGVVSSVDGSPIEYHKMICRGDRYKYSVRIGH